jgi:hypothetical protein
MHGLALGLLLAACTRADARDRFEDRDHSGAARRRVPPDARPPADARPGPPRVTHIAAGHEHTCALTLSPQQRTVPVSSMAHVWNAPDAMSGRSIERKAGRVSVPRN